MVKIFFSQNQVHVAVHHLKSVIIRIQIFNPTFCVSLYTLRITTYHSLFSFFINKPKFKMAKKKKKNSDTWHSVIGGA